MAEIVNLNRARKTRDKAAAKVAAAANRAVHGRSKAATQQAALERLAQARALDGHKRDPLAETGDGD